MLDELDRRKARILKLALQTFYLCQPMIEHVNRDGRVVRKKWTRYRFCKTFNFIYPTVQLWEKTGRISPFYERELIRIGVLEEPLPKKRKRKDETDSGIRAALSGK